MPDSVAYSVLSQQHDEYMGDLWQEIDDFYRGGYYLYAKAGQYLPRFVGENEARYADRIKQSVGYLNYLGEIVDEFTSELFAQDLTVTEASDAKDATTAGEVADKDFWPAFAKDADLNGATLADIEKLILTTALLKRRALLACDMPTALEQATVTSRADEDKLGARRAYIFELPLASVINWKRRERGAGFEWLVISRQYTPQLTPTSPRNVVVYEFKVWTLDLTTSPPTAAWALYQLKKDPGVQPKPEELVPCVSSGPTSFPCIPIVEMCVPDGLWIGNIIGGLCREHHQRRTSLNAAQNKSLASIPFVKLGPEMPEIGGAIPAEQAQNPYRGNDPRAQFDAKGYVVLGKDDDIGYAEPAGACYDLTSNQLKELKDEIFRIAHRLKSSADNSASASRASGDAKQSDRALAAIVLGALGKIVRAHAKAVYDVIAGGRGEKVIWTPRGLDKYDSTDRAAVLAEAVQVDLVGIPSPTFKKAYKSQIATQLTPNLPPETQDVIRQEIEDGVDAEVDMKGAMQDAALDQAQNPPKPVIAAPGAKGAPAPPSKNGAPTNAAAR